MFILNVINAFLSVKNPDVIKQKVNFELLVKELSIHSCKKDFSSKASSNNLYSLLPAFLMFLRGKRVSEAFIFS